MNKPSTQNDWEKRFDEEFPNLRMYYSDGLAPCEDDVKAFIAKELADERKEVMTKKEKDYLIALLTIVQTENEADRALGMRVNKEEEKMCKKILATLREEEKHG